MDRTLAASLAAILLLASGCATAPAAPPAPPAPAFATPSAERLARLDPFDRAALEVEGELVRIAVAPQDAIAAPAGRGRGAGPAPGPTIVAIREAGGKLDYSYVGPSAGWRGGLLARTPGLLAALEAARAASPVHRAVTSRIGAAEVSCALDKVPLGTGASPGWRYTLALTTRASRGLAAPGPAGARTMRASLELAVAAKQGAVSPGPFAILDLQAAGSGEAPVLRARSDRPLRHAGAVATVGEIRLAPDGGLASVALPPWRPPPDLFLAGRTARDVFLAHDMAGEQAINDAVVEWKTRQLPGWLQKASGAQLEESIVTTEKGILALDLAVRSVKDQADAAARKNEIAFADAGAIEQLLEQRKMLLGVVLQAMKGAAGQKAR